MRAGIGAIGRRWASATAEREHGAVSQDIGRLLITCPDRPGIVAAVSRFLYERGADILESQQYSTNPFGGTFFLLIEFHLPGLAGQTCELEEDFAALSDEFSMHWKMTRAAVGKRAAVFVSKADHALQELLWRVNSGELNADIVMVISNHEDLADVVAGWGIPFHHVRVSAETKPEAAAERGVKMVGATAHYVTAELDAGPIIEQDIVRVDHRCSADDLRRLGRHVERSVLARAVAWHVDDRVIVHQNKTIVFS